VIDCGPGCDPDFRGPMLLIPDFRPDDSICGIGLDRKMDAKWLFHRERATSHSCQEVDMYSENALKNSAKMISCLSNSGVSGSPSLWRTLAARVSNRRRIAAIVAFCMIASFAGAQNRMPEYAVKAAYLFNFGKFVRFAPSDAVNNRQTLDICIVGEDPFGHTLDDLTANERLDGKPVRVLRLKSASEARGCALAFISSSEGARVAADLDALRGQPVLTVSDAANFLQHGGMIQFLNVENHVRFAVNLDAVRPAQLSLSSELLRVATSVTGETSPGVRP